jgi:MFS family permease
MMFKRLTMPSWLNKNIVALGFTSLFSDLGHEMTTALLPAFIISIGGSPSILGFIEGCADAATSFIKIIAGWYSDYTGKRKPIAAFGYLTTALGIGLLTFTTTWPQVFFARIIAWMGKGLRKPARDALLADSIPSDQGKQYYGRIYGFHRAMDSIGAIGGPALAVLLMGYCSLRTMLFISFFPEFIAFCIILFLVTDSPKKEIVRQGFFASALALPYTFIIFLIAVCIFGIGNFAMSLFMLRAIQLLTPTHGATAAHGITIMCYALYNFIYALGSLPLGYLGDLMNKKVLLAIGYALTATTYVCLIFNPTSVIAIALLFILAGIGIAITDGTERATAAELLPEQVRGTGFGSLSFIEGIGDFASSIMVGLLWTNVSPAYGFLYASITCFLGALCMLYIAVRDQKSLTQKG